MTDEIETNAVFVVLRNRISREFRRVFSSSGAADGYIRSGQNSGIDGADEEFIERHTVRDS